MSGLARRRTAGFGVFLLMLSVLAFTMSGAAAAKDNPGGTHRPPEGCVKLEEEGGTPRVGVDGAVVMGGVTVEFTWIPKPGEPGEWIGFDWVATGGQVDGSVKAATKVYDWGPGETGTFLVPEEDGKIHAISYVIICTEPEVPPSEPTQPTTPQTEPTTPQTVTLPPQGSTVPAPTSTQPPVTIAPQQVTTTAAPTTTTTVGTLPYTGMGSSGLALMGLAMTAAGLSLLAVAASRREVEPTD